MGVLNLPHKFFGFFMKLIERYGAYKMSIFQGKVLLIKKVEIEKTKPTLLYPFLSELNFFRVSPL
jgi:hypothetical protein